MSAIVADLPAAAPILCAACRAHGDDSAAVSQCEAAAPTDLLRACSRGATPRHAHPRHGWGIGV